MARSAVWSFCSKLFIFRMATKRNVLKRCFVNINRSYSFLTRFWWPFVRVLESWPSALDQDNTDIDRAALKKTGKFAEALGCGGCGFIWNTLKYHKPLELEDGNVSLAMSGPILRHTFMSVAKGVCFKFLVCARTYREMSIKYHPDKNPATWHGESGHFCP